MKGLKSSPAKSTPAKVEVASKSLPATPNSQDVMQVESVTVGNTNVKRNLFGSSPMEDDELSVNESAPLAGINFSFCSPVKNSEGRIIPDSVSIHDSVSSALDQLPPLGDGDTAMIIDNDHNHDSDPVTEHACNEDDRWLENVSCSAWEGQLDGANQDMGGADAATLLRRFVIQSVVTRQRTDTPTGEIQTSTNIPRYLCNTFGF